MSDDSTILLKKMIENIESNVGAIRDDVSEIKESLGDYNVTLALHERRISELENDLKEEEKHGKSKSVGLKIAYLGFVFMIIQLVIQYFLTKI